MAKESDHASFGRLGRDARGGAMQTATKFSTRDAAGTPLVSPLAYTATVLTLTVPDDAVQLVLSPTTDLRVSEDSVMSRYDVIVAGAKEALPVALMTSVYIRRNTADGSLRFRFVRV